MLTIVDDRRSGYVLVPPCPPRNPSTAHGSLPCKKRRTVQVLTTDDDKGFRAPRRWILEAEGYAIPYAEKGRAALTLTNTRPPWLMLLEFMMPQINEFKFLARFAAIKRGGKSRLQS